MVNYSDYTEMHGHQNIKINVLSTGCHLHSTFDIGIFRYVNVILGRDSSQNIATHYGLEGPVFESRRRQDFPRPSKPALEPTLLHNSYRVFTGEKAERFWRWQPTPSSSDVKERVELYLYTPFRAFVDYSRMNYTFTLPFCIIMFVLKLYFYFPYMSFPGVKCDRVVLLTTHPLLVPRSWKSRAIPLSTLWTTPGL